MNANETPARRTFAATAAVPICAMLALVSVSGSAFAIETAQQVPSAGHAAGLFAITWLISCLRLRRTGRAWRIDFQPSPLRDLPIIGTPAAPRREGDVS